MNKVFSKTTKRLFWFCEFSCDKHAFQILPWVQFAISHPQIDFDDERRCWAININFGWMLFSVGLSVEPNTETFKKGGES